MYFLDHIVPNLDNFLNLLKLNFLININKFIQQI